MKSKIIKRTEINSLVRKLKRKGNKVVFTNGVFDIIHRGHVEYLLKAKSLGDVLIVGLNTDNSVKKFKDKNRPVNKQRDRAIVLLALKPVDYVVFFNEERPDKLIEEVQPDILVKGSDYKLNEIAGAKFVKSYGGQVKRIRFIHGYSTSKIIKKLLQ